MGIYIVAGGIKVALLTTVFGLIVAVILQVFYNYLISKVDSIVKPDEIKVIPGLGFPIKNSMTKGDFIVKFEIKFPDSIDTEKKKLIYKLLPKRTKIRNSEKKDLDEYYMENYNPRARRNIYDEDDEESNQGVQCATQ